MSSVKRKGEDKGESVKKGRHIDLKEYPVGKNFRRKAIIFYLIRQNDEDCVKKGNQKDAERLEKELKDLSFEVQVKKNSTVQEIDEALKHVSKDKTIEDSDCLVVAVISHGRKINESFEILAKDDEFYDEETLFKYFDGNSCPSLLGKPKIFLIQACRGDEFQTANLLMHQRGNREGNEREKINYYLPDNADFFVFRSTFDGTFAFTDTSGKGGFFIQAVCEELRSNREEHEYKLDFMTLMTFAVRRVATFTEEEKRSSKNPHGRNPQQPFIVSTLMRLLYLKPKIGP